MKKLKQKWTKNSSKNNDCFENIHKNVIYEDQTNAPKRKLSQGKLQKT